MFPSFPIPPALLPVLQALQAAGGRPVIVGGAVRDWLLGGVPKDLDVEVFGLDEVGLDAALAGFRVDAVGRSFGVLKVGSGSETFDVALPRRDSKAAPGHRGFVVTTDPAMSFADAAARRDFTINAMGWDVTTGELLDPHGGRTDLALRVLRHVSPAFAEDPLRVLRGCQFAARFSLRWAPDTVTLCRSLADELNTLPTERFWDEWQKLLLKSPRPSVGLDALVQTGAVAVFPELAALLGVPQDPEWHPEGQDHPLGSLWVHNGMVVDQAVRVLDDDGEDDREERLVVLLGALCHDFGKPSTTVREEARWRSRGHEEAGEAPTRSFLARIGCPARLAQAVVPLVQHHLKPFQLAQAQAGSAAVRRLALKAPLLRLTRVARADFLGRTTPAARATRHSADVAETRWLMARASALAVDRAAPRPWLQGRHLLALGHAAGPSLGAQLARAFEAQLDGAFDDEAGAIAWATAHLSTGGT